MHLLTQVSLWTQLYWALLGHSQEVLVGALWLNIRHTQGQCSNGTGIQKWEHWMIWWMEVYRDGKSAKYAQFDVKMYGLCWYTTHYKALECGMKVWWTFAQLGNTYPYLEIIVFCIQPFPRHFFTLKCALSLKCYISPNFWWIGLNIGLHTLLYIPLMSDR